VLVNAVYNRSHVSRRLLANLYVCAGVLVNAVYNRSRVSRRLLASL
jgi:hypothetical protein